MVAVCHRMWTMTARRSTAFTCRLPPWLKRWRPLVLPESAWMGHSAQSFANVSGADPVGDFGPSHEHLSAAMPWPMP